MNICNQHRYQTTTFELTENVAYSPVWRLKYYSTVCACQKQACVATRVVLELVVNVTICKPHTRGNHSKQTMENSLPYARMCTMNAIHVDSTTNS